jgi:2-polyprenyl-3-methyl-5-hydroxy-6-metoxy-1,4-benzoquinol methylase
MPSSTADRGGPGLAHFFSIHYEEHNRARLDHLASLELPLSHCRVLELGSGPGDHTGFYAQRGCKIVAVDARQDCLDALKERYPDVETRVCDLNAPTPLAKLGAFDVVHCYGILYHLENPAGLIDYIGEVCRRIAIVETCVLPADSDRVIQVEEASGDYTQSSTGQGCRPGRRWVFEELRRVFPFVYHTRTQPNHPEFPVDWNDLSGSPALVRAVFVASKQPLDLPSLSPILLDVQERFQSRPHAAEGDNTGPALVKLFPGLPEWALEMALVTASDERLPSQLQGINLALNRPRLATFLAQFAEDKDVRDLLALDLIGSAAGLPLSSTGLIETKPTLVLRPFRLWEYAWLYKALQLSTGGMRVLDLGGPATHLSILTALAECHVTSVDVNPVFVEAAHECARILQLPTLDARLGDMRDLSEFADESFDAVMTCSVLEHLTGEDQAIALREVARVLKPGGVAGLTFDFGIPAPGANEYLSPPHDPPQNAAMALGRYSQGTLAPIGNTFAEGPIPGSLFQNESVHYTVASLFLAKPPAPEPHVPQFERGRSVLESLVMQALPYRLFGNVSRALAADHELQHRATTMEAAAAERLHALLETDRALRETRQQLEQMRAISRHGAVKPLEAGASFGLNPPAGGVSPPAPPWKRWARWMKALTPPWIGIC